MKKILIILIGVAIFQSCTVTITPNEDVHYIGDDFILLDKYEENDVRTWKIQKIIGGTTDSVMVAEISDNEDNGCGCGIITDELWFKRNVGDILHFEYIRKDRFFATKNTALDNWGGYVDESTTITTPEPVEFTTVNTTIINLNKLEIERRMMEIDREIMALERELETLIESQK